MPQVPVLSVSPTGADCDALAEIMPAPDWTIHGASSLPGAIQLLANHHPIPVVICERDVAPHSWRDLLVEIGAMSKPPFLIVTSHHADGHLWAEALNLGAYDVLPKPFDAAEVRRTLSIAAFNWKCKHEAPFRSKTMSA